MTKIPTLKLPTETREILNTESFRRTKGVYHVKGLHKTDLFVERDFLEKVSKERAAIHVGQKTTLNLGDITEYLFLTFSGNGKVKVNKLDNARLNAADHLHLEIQEQLGGSTNLSGKSKTRIEKQLGGINYIDGHAGAKLDITQHYDGSIITPVKKKSIEEVLAGTKDPEDELSLGARLYKGFVPEPVREGLAALKKAPDAIRREIAFLKKSIINALKKDD